MQDDRWKQFTLENLLMDPTYYVKAGARDILEKEGLITYSEIKLSRGDMGLFCRVTDEGLKYWQEHRKGTRRSTRPPTWPAPPTLPAEPMVFDED